jgi:hypothetical protein
VYPHRKAPPRCAESPPPRRALLIRWLPASYARDVFVPLVVLGASLSIAFVVLTQEAVAEVEPDAALPLERPWGRRWDERELFAHEALVVVVCQGLVEMAASRHDSTS